MIIKFKIKPLKYCSCEIKHLKFRDKFKVEPNEILVKKIYFKTVWIWLYQINIFSL